MSFFSFSRYSNGNKLCPSFSRHISLLIWSRIYTVFALNREETVGVSVQFYIHVHRWCFVHKQPRVWELPGPDVSCWSRDQRHDRNTSAFYLDLPVSIRRDGQQVSLSQMLHDILGHDHIQWHPQLIRHCTYLRIYETNISWTCLVSGLLSFEHLSVLLFLLITELYFNTDFDLITEFWRFP